VRVRRFALVRDTLPNLLKHSTGGDSAENTRCERKWSGSNSLSGLHGGMIDPLPLMTMFDKQIQLRLGQANGKKWVDGIMP
jgi:hypothetical protein